MNNTQIIGVRLERLNMWDIVFFSSGFSLIVGIKNFDHLINLY